jgi:hypothetical protein
MGTPNKRKNVFARRKSWIESEGFRGPKYPLSTREPTIEMMYNHVATRILVGMKAIPFPSAAVLANKASLRGLPL